MHPSETMSYFQNCILTSTKKYNFLIVKNDQICSFLSHKDYAKLKRCHRLSQLFNIHFIKWWNSKTIIQLQITLFLHEFWFNWLKFWDLEHIISMMQYISHLNKTFEILINQLLQNQKFEHLYPKKWKMLAQFEHVIRKPHKINQSHQYWHTFKCVRISSNAHCHVFKHAIFHPQNPKTSCHLTIFSIDAYNRTLSLSQSSLEEIDSWFTPTWKECQSCSSSSNTHFNYFVAICNKSLLMLDLT